MKLYSRYLAAFVAFTALFSWATAAVASHNHLKFTQKVTTTYILVDDQTKQEITVIWEALEPPSNPPNPKFHQYKVIISSTNPLNGNYSLLTLGFQRIGAEINITRAYNIDVGGAVKFVSRPTIAAPTPQPQQLASPQLVPRAGVVWDSGVAKEKIDPDTICMLNLTNSKTFTFDVEQVNTSKRAGITTWTSNAAVGGGHDNDPPHDPPD